MLKRLFIVIALLAVGATIALIAMFWSSSKPPCRLEIQSTSSMSVYYVDVAKTPQAWARGLSGRGKLKSDEGLLIDYGETRIGVVFWTKGVNFPIDILFAGNDLRVFRIERDAKPDSEYPIPSGGPTRWVLELDGGSVERTKIAVGAEMVLTREGCLQ